MPTGGPMYKGRANHGDHRSPTEKRQVAPHIPVVCCDKSFTTSLATKAWMSWSSHPGAPRHSPPCVVVSAPMSQASIEVIINGETRTVLQGTTVAALINELGLGDRRVAVERNREVVPRAEHASTVLASGDKLELVTFVGGGL